MSERDRLKEEAEKLKRELAVAKRRFEKEEKLAAEKLFQMQPPWP